MNILQIKYFLGVAKELSYSRASEKMFIAQSALSRQIMQLEEEINVLLFDRNKRNIKLTPAGVFLQSEWERMLNEMDNICRHAQLIHQGEKGELRIGHPGSAVYTILPEVLTQMRKTLPNVSASLVELTEMEIVQSLINFKIDVGFTREILDHSLLEIKLLFDENFALVVPENHPITTENFTDLSMVKNEPFIIPSLKAESKYCVMLLDIFKEHNFNPNIIYESNYGATIIRLVEQNLGISILPISYQNSENSKIRFIKLPYETQLYIAYRKNDLNPILKNFLQTCKSVIN